MFLMCMCHKERKTACFTETDSQGSIKDFIEDRKTNARLSEIPYFECYTDIPAMAQKLAARFDYVFVDTPGMKSPAFVKALSCAHILFTFIEPDQALRSTHWDGWFSTLKQHRPESIRQ